MRKCAKLRPLSHRPSRASLTLNSHPARKTAGAQHGLSKMLSANKGSRIRSPK